MFCSFFFNNICILIFYFAPKALFFLYSWESWSYGRLVAGCLSSNCGLGSRYFNGHLYLSAHHQKAEVIANSGSLKDPCNESLENEIWHVWPVMRVLLDPKGENCWKIFFPVKSTLKIFTSAVGWKFFWQILLSIVSVSSLKPDTFLFDF